MEKENTTIKYFEVAIKDEEMPIPNDEDPISYVMAKITGFLNRNDRKSGEK